MIYIYERGSLRIRALLVPSRGDRVKPMRVDVREG
jgi:hypothetical protein